MLANQPPESLRPQGIVPRKAVAGTAWASLATAALFLALALSPVETSAAVGVGTIPASGDLGAVTVLYPTSAAPARVERGPFALTLAVDAEPRRGNGRLIVISHGSGGSPWVHLGASEALVNAGFVVALPEHRGDNWRDPARPGPESWTMRPSEVIRAIDAVGRDARFAPVLELARVGVYGMSAGGHTALSLAGGRWSPARLVRHCEAHLADDFQSCVGLSSELGGSALDSVRLAIAMRVIRSRFAADERLRSDGDPRIAAVAAGVPFAADFDPESLAAPRVPLGIVTARRDLWLNSRFHADAILAACRPCEHILDLPDGGHGALLSPLPPGLDGLIGRLLNDPPGFDRAAATADVHARLVSFFTGHLR